jgi:hypothetical protein
MRKAILGAATAVALASPAVTADLPVPPYSEVPGYEYPAGRSNKSCSRAQPWEAIDDMINTLNPPSSARG